MKKITLLLTTLLFAGSFNSCYLAKQGYKLLGHNLSAKSLESVYKDPEVGDNIKDRLKLIFEIREFAINKIGLKKNKNYTTYVEMNDRNYLTNVLVISKADKFEKYKWSFPFFGSFPYKGFYDLEDAQATRDEFVTKGYDTYIRKAGAFSTLGWFNDPIYSYMLNYSTEYLANLIIHEMVHSTVFIKDNIQFNEEMANFVGNTGSVMFLEYKFGKDSAKYKRSFALKEDSKTFGKYINHFHGELNKLYKSDKSKAEKLKEKEEIIEANKKYFHEKVVPQFKVKGSYAWFPKMKLNNAVIGSFLTYEQDYSLYEDAYEINNSNLRRTVNFFKKIEKMGGNPKENLKKLVNDNKGV